ncbi:3-hydroxyisobutyrate dehydrogenase/putative dehydrogenase [Solirubrobacter pauli]|uniref:3-hydroxyisobutyrate dehydrogenase/putative dehydrogenase n=1 Tax=Solirubrobacter pauli TaxID=166793 RepID=A0A660L571_9ACTN|nr:NAD(P)-dependent oxidoreductase [Solirubrobacter pauli]RKQ88344.1 3-hydroxyisobutyrate dehydrogenase/putative dehydrogenase [Solirubrobacter pauli]
MELGWIGLGAMGAPMVACLERAGHAVLAFDADPSRTRVASVAEAAGAPVVVVMVATPDQLDAVLEAAAPADDAVLVVMSTVGPAPVQAWAERLPCAVVDAPVSGGVARAEAGDLLIMVAGEEDAVARVRPLLDALARSAPVVGAQPGDGQKVKLVNQLLCGVHIAAAAEALAFAEALGLEAAAVRDVVREGAAASFMLDDRGERMVEGDFDAVKSALDIFVKDMGLVTDAARGATYPAPLASAAEQLYLAGRRAGLGHLDDASLIEVLRGDR